MFKTTKPENYYFYGKSEGIRFYQMPNIIMDEPRYNKISDSAKILYMLLFRDVDIYVCGTVLRSARCDFDRFGKKIVQTSYRHC